MNNYWCQKHSPNDPWRGAVNTTTLTPIEDVGHHAVFSSADWSARAIAIDLRSKYYKNGLKTATAIAAAYSPWCDTKGSVVINKKTNYGRSCSDNPKPSSNFKGPFCKAPENPRPQKSDCLPGCNCPPEIAEMLVDGMKIGISDDLMLFDSNRVAGKYLPVLIKNLARQENSVIVSDKLIERGIRMLDE